MTNRKPPSPELLRKIDRLDLEIVKLANERAKLSRKVAEVRKAADLAPYDFNAETIAVEKAVDASRGPLPERAVRAIVRELNGGARTLVAPLKVAYLGPQYSYSHVAAVEKFGTSADLAPVGTIAAVFDEVNRRQVDYGLVPIENSTDGRIVDTLDMFSRLPVRIGGEVQLRIHHNLLGKCGRTDVTEVFSKPQALSQCREWLAKHLPQARPVEMTSTAAAAQLAADKPGAAAVASLAAAAHYGLAVIAENIEDNPHNVTRFAIIGGALPRRTGKDKTALMFEVPHKPGALADVMTIFKKARLNLTWIESFPIPGKQNEYRFFVELEGHQNDSKVSRAIVVLGKKTVRLEILGSYPKTDPLE